MERRIDAIYPLHGFSSCSELVCKAVDFHIGFLESKQSAEYINQTTLAFLQDKLERLESRICKRLFRMCVETAVASHVFAAFSQGVDDDTMAKLREGCVKDVRKTVASIRYDSIYAFQHAVRDGTLGFGHGIGPFFFWFETRKSRQFSWRL